MVGLVGSTPLRVREHLGGRAVLTELQVARRPCSRRRAGLFGVLVAVDLGRLRDSTRSTRASSRRA